MGLFTSSSTDILDVLKRDSETLANMQQDFHDMLRSKPLARDGFELHITCFYETLEVKGVGFVSCRYKSLETHR